MDRLVVGVAIGSLLEGVGRGEAGAQVFQLRAQPLDQHVQHLLDVAALPASRRPFQLPHQPRHLRLVLVHLSDAIVGPQNGTETRFFLRRTRKNLRNPIATRRKPCEEQTLETATT